MKQAREDLEKWLMHSAPVTSLTRYKKADQLFKEEKIWTDVNDDDRRDIYRAILVYLEKKERVS